MYIQVRLKDVGWTKLYVQTDAKDNTMFLLVDNNLDVSKPYLALKMKDDSLAIKHQRGEVEDDNDELKEKLNGLYLRIIEAKKQDSIYPDSKNQTVMNHPVIIILQFQHYLQTYIKSAIFTPVP